MPGQEQDAWLANALGVSVNRSSQAGEGSASQAAAAQSALPTIWVTPNGDGSFVIDGVAFSASASVRIRIVDDALHEIDFTTTADGQGKFKFPTGGICQLPGNLHFSATDGRPPVTKDLTGVLWSNTVTESCPPSKAPDDNDDDSNGNGNGSSGDAAGGKDSSGGDGASGSDDAKQSTDDGT
jgi:hypothetical protein